MILGCPRIFRSILGSKWPSCGPQPANPEMFHREFWAGMACPWEVAVGRAQPHQESCLCGAHEGTTAYLTKGAAGGSYGLRVWLREGSLEEDRESEGVIRPVPGPPPNRTVGQEC